MSNDYEKVIDELIEQTKGILKNNLIGIYLHGSAAMECFNPAKSDIDLIIIVKDNMPKKIKRGLMDMLDVTDRHYNRKYQDMQDRLDTMYDRINELEDAIAEVNSKMSGAFDEQITAESLCKILLDFDIMYSKMSDADKKQFFQKFVKSIEIYPDASVGASILKHITFKFPISYDAEEDGFLLCKRNDVETVCLLVNQNAKAKQHVNVGIDAEEYYRIKNS